MIYGIIIVVCIFVAVKWVEGIDSMKNLHPEYKGEDFP
jgi:hypothetical protein